ncbi:MAG: ribulose-phosphate 3-epimerase [Chloroflexota bacterium]
MNRNSIKLAPSILTADFGHMAEAVQAAEEGGADWLHLDVMDGQFVPNISFGPMVINSIRTYTSLPLDVHLMVDEPEHYLQAFADAGAQTITVHQEATRHLHRAIQQIQDLGCQAGVALNPATPNQLLEELLPSLDLVLVMSVNPGFGGQKFIEYSHNKLRRMRDWLDVVNPECQLEVDGGVGYSNIRQVADSGANVMVVGSAVYNETATVAENLADLRKALEG